MRIYFASLNRIPSRGTHTITIVHTSRGLATIPGVKVKLIIARHKKIEEEYRTEPFAFYGIRKNIDVIWLSQSKWVGLFKHILFFTNLFKLLIILFKLFWDRKEDFIIYSRHPGLTSLVQLFQYLTKNPNYLGFFCELHGLPKKSVKLHKCQGIITISNSLKKDILTFNKKVPDAKILVAHDGVDIDKFADIPEPREAKNRLGITSNRLIIGYIGRVNVYKGAGILINAFNRLEPDVPLTLMMVGKIFPPVSATQIETGSKKAAIFPGHIIPKDIPIHLAAMDILILPSTKDLSYWKYTSPLKLFEYMAAKKPIIAAALPGVMEIIKHGRNGLLFEPGDDASLAARISELIANPCLRNTLGENAFSDVLEFSWSSRARRIWSFIEKDYKNITRDAK